jgi:hypothetical protein
VALANHEQFELFVSGTSLYFQAPWQAQGNSYTITPRDLMDLRMEWALPLAGGIEITVKSWNHWQQDAIITTTASSSELLDGQLAGPASRYQLTRPNLTPSDADALARRQLAQIACHERVIEFELPGELVMTPRDLIMLKETNTTFDQTYTIETIYRRISEATGFVERIRAKSASSPSTTTGRYDAGSVNEQTG